MQTNYHSSIKALDDICDEKLVQAKVDSVNHSYYFNPRSKKLEIREAGARHTKMRAMDRHIKDGITKNVYSAATRSRSKVFWVERLMDAQKQIELDWL